MASPPFNINEVLPGDSDIVSQHPFNARAFRDIVESWLLINHNNLGQHSRIELPWGAAPAAVANVSTLYADTVGNIHKLDTTDDKYLGLPPGSIVYGAFSTLPNGFLWPIGTLISRATFAALFTAISTQFGVGDGSTTFALPNIRGYLIGIKDTLGGAAAGNRITTAGSGVDGATLGAVGSSENVGLAAVNLPAHYHDVFAGVETHSHGSTGGSFLVNVGGSIIRGDATSATYSLAATTAAAATGLTVRDAAAGGGNANRTSVAGSTMSGTAFGRMPPTFILNAIIKY